MTTYTQKQLDEILHKHSLWLENDENGVKADLSDVDLSGANLSFANLRHVNLKGADLTNTNLRGIIFNYCTGNNKEIKSLQIGTYLISYHKDILNIGCKTHTLKEWENFTDGEIAKMDEDALNWWKLNKDIVLTLVRREI